MPWRILWLAQTGWHPDSSAARLPVAHAKRYHRYTHRFQGHQRPFGSFRDVSISLPAPKRTESLGAIERARKSDLPPNHYSQRSSLLFLRSRLDSRTSAHALWPGSANDVSSAGGERRLRKGRNDRVNRP